MITLLVTQYCLFMMQTKIKFVSYKTYLTLVFSMVKTMSKIIKSQVMNISMESELEIKADNKHTRKRHVTMVN